MSNPNISIKSRRSIRLPGYDYRQTGVYFVTLCTYQKAKLFGAVDDGEMILSALGTVVIDEWQHIAKVRSNVKLDLFVVMPNHFHGLVIINARQNNDVCPSVSASPIKSSRTLQADSLGAIIGQFKVAVTRRAKSSQIYSDQRIWQRNYHEHIVRNEESLNDIRRYIIENPARWAEDSLYVE